MPACSNAHPLARRGLVERAGLLGAPVDQQGALVVVAQSDAADVAMGVAVGGLVEQQAPEDEPGVDVAQLRQLVFVEAREGVAFTARLMVAPDALTAHPGQPFLGFGTQFVEPFVQGGDDCTLAFELRFLHADHLSIAADSLLPPAWKTLRARSCRL